MPIALITGGSRGLGRAAALHLARAGTDVIVTWHSGRDAAQAVVAEVAALGRKAAALHLDVADSGSFAAFAARLAATLADLGHDRPDDLVNNAGVGLYAPFADTTEAQFDRMVAVHLKSAFFLTQALLPLLRDGGRILNLSTGLARFSLPGYAAYATMKGGVETLTRYMARELAPRGISVNVIAPGAIETDFGGGAVRDNPDVNRFVASVTAMGRAGRPDDIGAAVASRLTSQGNWMTGQRIEVSGGMFL
jgi:NAD(P)-dependent dehydrogenase (short-subunit alcohol dehydrogenase family)